MSIVDCLARRARDLSTTYAAAHFPAEFSQDTVLFDSGFAAPQLLPDLGEVAAKALVERGDEVLQYSSGRGQFFLREWISAWMNGEGCELTPDHILITSGAKQGIDLICRLLIDEGDSIIVTAPTYFTAIPIFRNYGAKFIEIEQDEFGLNLEALEKVLDQRGSAGQSPPKFIYSIPEFHNPTGVTMPESRRKALIDFAERRGIPIIEDSPYRQICFEKKEPPSFLKAIDHSGIVFHLGTFSKLVAPGLRIGWIAADPALLARMVQLKSEGGTSPLIQRIIHEFVSSAKFPEHIQKVRAGYCDRRDRMLAAISRHLPDAKVAVPDGGYYVWLTLPRGVDGDMLAARSFEVGVHIVAGSRFFANEFATAPKHHVRLAYSYSSPEQIEVGLKKMGAVYRELSAK